MSDAHQSNWAEAAKVAGRAVAAAGRVATAALTGQQILVPLEVAQERLAICDKCEWLKRGDGAAEGFWVCLRCGCGLNGKVRCKAFLATETCPDQRWTKL